jgi:hypothetical protein
MANLLVEEAPAVDRGTGPSLIRPVITSPQHVRIPRAVWAFLVFFSALYVASTLIRSFEKFFWFDELFTVYLCRFDFAAILDALRKGVDFNPPLFFAITKVSQALFGPGRLGTRLPEIVGFWIFCLCLFRFVRKNAGNVAGIIAMVTPLLTGAAYYSFEARPPALVLAFCGLSLVSWQNALDAPSRFRHLIGFSCCLFAAFMTHCYAMVMLGPFVIVEIFRTSRTKRIEWKVWCAMLFPAILATASYLPLLQAYRSIATGTNFAASYAAKWEQVRQFYPFLLAPYFAVFVLGLLAVCAQFASPDGKPEAENVQQFSSGRAEFELVLSAAFLAFPVYGMLLGQFVHGPFIARYFLPAVAGLCCCLAFALGLRRRNQRIALVVAAVATSVVVVQVMHVVQNRLHRNAPAVVEPSSGFDMNTSLTGPLEHYKLLLTAGSDRLPIAILNPLDFLYLVHYSPELRGRLYYVSNDSHDLFQRGFALIRPWVPFRYNKQLSLDEFERLSPAYFVYGESQYEEISEFMVRGDDVNWWQSADGRFLVHMGKRIQPSTASPSTATH